MSLRTNFRPVATGCAVLLAGASLVVGIATPALAHHNTIRGTVECGSTPNTWVVTWAVENSEQDKVEKITDSNRPNVIAVGTTIGAGKTFVGNETLNQAADVTLQVKAQWDNGATNASQGSVSKDQFLTDCWGGTSDACADLPGDQPEGFPCTMEPVERRVPGSAEGCAIGGIKTWVDVYTTTYTFKDGKWIANPETGPVRINEEFVAYSPQQLVDLGCATVLTRPSVTAIDECGTLHDFVTLSSGPHYKGADNGAGLATFTAAKGYVFESNDVAGRNRYVTTLTLKYPVPSTKLCPVVPVAIKVSPPTCKHGGRLTIPSQPMGVRVSPAPGSYGPGTYHVRFSAVEGYELTKDRSRRVRIGKAIFVHCPAASAESAGPDAQVSEAAVHAGLPNTGVSARTGATGVAGMALLLGGAGMVLVGRRRLG